MDALKLCGSVYYVPLVVSFPVVDEENVFTVLLLSPFLEDDMASIY